MRASPINQAINCIQIEFNSARAQAATLSVYIIIAGWQARKNAPRCAQKKTPSSTWVFMIYSRLRWARSQLWMQVCRRLSPECSERRWRAVADSCSGAQRYNSLAGVDLIRNQSALMPRNAALTINCINIACRPTLSRIGVRGSLMQSVQSAVALILLNCNVGQADSTISS